MKKRSFTLLMSALTISATLIGTSPVAAKTDTDTATEETTDKEETTARDADSENTDNKETDASKGDTLEDGTYTAEFDTDSGMFHVNEANDGKGTLTVKDGKMTIHVSLASKKIVNLFVGKAEDAQKDGAEILEPTTKAAITNLFLSSWSLCIHLSARLNENRTAQGMVDIRTPHSPKCPPA